MVYKVTNYPHVIGMLPDSLRESASPMTESRKIRHMFDLLEKQDRRSTETSPLSAATARWCAVWGPSGVVCSLSAQWVG